MQEDFSFAKLDLSPPNFQKWSEPIEQQDPTKKYCSQCDTKFEKLYYIFTDFYICEKCFLDQQKLLHEMKVEKLKKNQLYPQIDQILPNLYLGNQDSAISPKTFSQLSISAILTCGDNLLMRYPSLYPYKQYIIADNPLQQISHLFQDSYQWINKMHSENRKVLIHCAAGISRSASFTIAFIMKDKEMGYQEAKRFVKDRRRWANPNTGFVSQLMDYEKQLYQNKIKEFQPKCQDLANQHDKQERLE